MNKAKANKGHFPINLLLSILIGIAIFTWHSLSTNDEGLYQETDVAADKDQNAKVARTTDQNAFPPKPEKTDRKDDPTIQRIQSPKTDRVAYEFTTKEMRIQTQSDDLVMESTGFDSDALSALHVEQMAEFSALSLENGTVVLLPGQDLQEDPTLGKLRELHDGQLSAYEQQQDPNLIFLPVTGIGEVSVTQAELAALHAQQKALHQSEAMYAPVASKNSGIETRMELVWHLRDLHQQQRTQAQANLYDVAGPTTKEENGPRLLLSDVKALHAQQAEEAKH